MLVVAFIILANVSAPAGAGNESAVINYLRPALKYIGGAARLYYAATCSADKDEFGQPSLLFPLVDLQPPSPGATGMATLQQLFRGDPNVTVTQDRSGMVRITIGNVSTAILQTSFPVLTLDSSDQYSPLAALLTIESTPEIDAAERKLNVDPKQGVIDVIVSGRFEGAPHLPAVMQNITLDEALDSIARTFQGIVVYGICTLPDGEGLFLLNYIDGS